MRDAESACVFVIRILESTSEYNADMSMNAKNVFGGNAVSRLLFTAIYRLYVLYLK